MKLTIESADLKAACDTAAPAVATKSTVPALMGLKLCADSFVTLSATDNEMYIQSDANAQVNVPGTVCVSAQQLLAVLRETDGEVYLEKHGDELVLSAGMDEYRLPTSDPKDFPEFPAVEGEPWELPVSEFVTAVKRTKYPVREEGYKAFSLSGLNFEFKDGELSLSGSDVKVLSLATMKVKGPDWTGLVPGQFLASILKLSGVTVNLYGTKNTLTLDAGKTRMNTKLVAGRYVPYRQLFAEKRPVEVKVPTDALVAACRKAKLMTSEDVSRAKFAVSKDRIDVTIVGKGKCTTAVQGVEFDGDPFDFLLDPQYVMETAQACGGESLTLSTGKGSTVELSGNGFRGLIARMAETA